LTAAASIPARRFVLRINPAKAFIGLGAFLSGFVINEPAPYELYMSALIGVWFILGLRITANAASLLTLLVFFNVGGLLSLTTMAELDFDAVLYMAVSLFLALSAVFFAAIIEQDESRLATIFYAYLAGALVTATIGIAAYFYLIPGSEAFILYDRAKGTFQDPNVFGPFLILPIVFLLHSILSGPLLAAPLRIAAFLVLSFGVFLSFSRAAWGLYFLSVALLILLMLLKENAPAFRMKIIGLSVAGLGLVVVALVIALQFEQVSSLFADRAQLVQSYDTAVYGRFARHGIGFYMAMEHPLGIGPVVFGTIYGEDTHNIWLKALLDYGWIGFASYFTLIALTLAVGFKCLLRDRTWQPFLLCAYVVFVGHVLIGTVIDTDHWRHFYLILGLIWGCFGLERRYQRERSESVPDS